MYFSSVDRSCVKLFLFSTVLPNITFLEISFVVVQWENENSVSVVNEASCRQPHSRPTGKAVSPGKKDNQQLSLQLKITSF